MIPSSSYRVPSRTSDASNARIRRRTEMSIAYFGQHPQQIPERISELDREWDIERALETMASSLSLLGLGMTLLRGRKWLILPLAVQGFFLQHALQGWCPPLPVLRGLGFRTRDEINIERYALKAMRGDFEHLPETTESRGSAPVVEAVRR